MLLYILYSGTLFLAISQDSVGNPVGSCNDKICEFPFVYQNHAYNKCTTIRNDYPWCITDQKLWDAAGANLTLPNRNKAGWEYCSAGCEIEHKICKECEASFVFDGKRHFGCTKYQNEDGHPDLDNDRNEDRKEWAWCVTNNTEFNDIDWVNSDARAGWEYCSENCTVSNHISIKYEPCNHFECQFPFVYKNYEYTGCTTVGPINYPWCVTDQMKFDYNNQSLTKGNGWTPCSKNCRLDHKICRECQPTFEYDHERLKSCTAFDSELWDKTTEDVWKWCVLNQTEFDSRGGGKGWEYCSRDCILQQLHNTTTSLTDALFIATNENQHTNCYIIVGVVLLVSTLAFGTACIYFKRRVDNISDDKKDDSTSMDASVGKLKNHGDVAYPSEEEMEPIESAVLLHQPPPPPCCETCGALMPSIDIRMSQVVPPDHQHFGKHPYFGDKPHFGDHQQHIICVLCHWHYAISPHS